MICWMLWHGGVNYSPPDVDQAERREKASTAARSDENCTEPESSYYPGAYPEPGGPTATITFGDEPPGGDFCPDRVLSFGRRGGVRVERA